MGLKSEGDVHVYGEVDLYDDMGLVKIGNHLAIKSDGGRYHFIPHSEYEDGLSQGDTTIIDSTSYVTRMVLQADNSGSWTGTTFEYTTQPVAHILAGIVYNQTDSTAATAPVRVCIWKGTDDTGVLEFDQVYPASLFPANSEIQRTEEGGVEYDEGEDYFIRYESAANFSLKLDVTNTYPWLASDVSILREDNLLQTAEWKDGYSWTSGDYFIDSRKIYVCNTTGQQDGTFASNAALWDEMATLADTAHNKLTSNDSYKQMLLTNSLLEYWDGSDVRLKVNSASTSLYSPDQTAFIALNDGGEFDVWLAIERMSIDATRAHITSPDGNQSLVVDDAGAFYNGVELLTDSNPATDRIVSPDTLKDLIVSDLNLLYSDGSYARLYIDGNESRLTSPDGQSKMSVKDGDFNFDDGTRDRIEADGIGTTLRSTTGAYLSMLSNTLLINDNTRNRLEIDASVTTLRGPTGADLILADTWLAFNDGTRTRLNISSANAALYSPDGSKYLNITNAASTFIGNMTVNAFTKLGSAAPSIKMKKLTGTTPAVEGNSVTIAHGLTGSKILAVDVLVGYSSNANNGMPPGYLRIAGYEYYAYQTSSGIVVYLSATNSERILSDTIRILITYED